MPPVIGDDGTPSGFTASPPFGVWGDSGQPVLGPGANGVVGSSSNGSGVAGFTLVDSNRTAGVYGQGPRVGVAGGIDRSNTAPTSRVGVYGTGSNGRRLGGIGVHGEGDTGTGVLGSSRSGRGVSGDSNTGPGVAGFSQTGAGVLGLSSQNTGVFGISNEIGVFGLGGFRAGLFLGDVEITGSLSKGGGGFQIDHPLDPGNRYLRHSFVESPEMKNLYDGIAECGDDGTAVVELPAWFEALNRDFRYQLTPIGAPGPNLFVAKTIRRGRFTIGGGAGGLKVSWQVTGVRKDAWAKAHAIVVEEDKAADDQGRYLHPEAHGRRRKRALAHERYEAEAREHLARSERRDGE